MGDWLAPVLVLAAGAVIVGSAWIRLRARSLARARVAGAGGEADSEEERRESVRPRAAGPLDSRASFGWPAVAAVLALAGGAALGWPPAFVPAVGLIAGILAHLGASAWLERRSIRLEQQLADAVDLLVASIRAGAGLLDALEIVVRESSRPLRPELEDALARIRFGESPARVFGDLGRRVPLESFHLFAVSQSVHWEVGGSLAASLTSVGRFIRDRVEVRRRIAVQSAQARASTVAVAAATYFIAFVGWRSQPERMEGFLGSTAGSTLAAVAITMQALGLLWMVRLSRIRY